MTPPVEIQGQRVSGTAHDVDLQALDGSCHKLSVWQLQAEQSTRAGSVPPRSITL